MTFEMVLEAVDKKLKEGEQAKNDLQQAEAALAECREECDRRGGYADEEASRADKAEERVEQVEAALAALPVIHVKEGSGCPCVSQDAVRKALEESRFHVARQREGYRLRKDDEGYPIECEICRQEVPLDNFRVWSLGTSPPAERDSWQCEFCSNTCSSATPIEPQATHMGLALVFHKLIELEKLLKR